MSWARVYDMLKHVSLERQDLCRDLMAKHRDRLKAAPGSGGAHHAWPGGYLEHVLQCMRLAVDLRLVLPRPAAVSVQDAVLVMFLHDLEKPWRYVAPVDPRAAGSKNERGSFRDELIRGAGIVLTDGQAEAVRHVEGEGDDYVPGGRAMSPLAAFCHACDVISARILFDEGRPTPSGGT